MANIRISVDIPNHKKVIEEGLKNPVISRVSVSISSFGSSAVECTYDEKKYASVDKFKLERELKESLRKLGYKVR
jgi:hypothetical protein